MSHSLPLSSRSALGEERAFKNSITGLNISAPRLLQVISNYSADKRLLAQGAWHPRCHSRGLDTVVPQPLLLPVGIQGPGRKEQKDHGPAQAIIQTCLATWLNLVSLNNAFCSHWVHSPTYLTHAWDSTSRASPLWNVKTFSRFPINMQVTLPGMILNHSWEHNRMSTP